MTLAQKELVLLWLMMTTRDDFSPANALNATADDILNGICNEYNAAPPGGNWNWNNLTRAAASDVASAAIAANRAAAPAAVAAAPTPTPFFRVNSVFTNFIATQPSSPWPGGGNHPPVSEVKVDLGML